jgi:transcriptional regulator with XRE-family HTH domain
MAGSQFQQRLAEEFDARRKKNLRYSLRAFAAFLETDHSTLSQILRDKRPTPSTQLRKWGRKLGMSSEEISAHIVAQQVPEPSTAGRQEQLRHWTAEALAILSDRSHWQLLRLSRSRTFQGDSRWLAAQMGISVDQVNVVLSRLLRLRLLAIEPSGKWKCLCDSHNEAAFRKCALLRVREFAARDGIRLSQLAKQTHTSKEAD